MAWVQGPAGASASAGSVAATFASSTPAGNLVVVAITQIFGGNSPKAITNVRDNVDTGVDYSLAKSQVVANHRIDTYYKLATSAGTRTVTCTFSGGSADASIGINEYDATYTTFSSANTNEADGSGTSTNPGAITPTGTAQYISVIVDEDGGTITPDAAYTQRQEIESNSISPINVHDLITSGSQNPTGTLGTSGAWGAVIIAFEASRPTINTQPAHQQCWEGQTATFTISVTASAGSLSYQWKDDGSNVGTDSNSYTTGTAVYSTDNGAQITCVVTDDNGSTTSSAATWTVLQTAKPFYLKA